jgi:hypothetical protein
MSSATDARANFAWQDSRWLALAWGAAGFAACASMVPLEPNLLEEGALLHFAQRLLDGERLYRDVASFTGPLPTVALAGLFRLFGEEIWVARAAVAVLHGLATLATFALARQAGAAALAHAAAAVMAGAPVLLFPLFSLYFYATLACQLSVVATALAAVGFASPVWGAAAGVAVAAVALTKQSAGAALALTLTLGWWLAARRRPDRARGLAAFVLAGAGTACVVLGYYALRGEASLVVDSLVRLPLSFTSSFDSPFPNLWPLGELSPELAFQRLYYLPHAWVMLREPGADEGAIVALTQGLYALPFVALAATLARALAFRRLGSLAPAVVLHGGLLLALASNLFPRADWGHLVFALPVALVQLLLLVPTGAAASRAVGRPRLRSLAALGGVVAVAVLCTGVGSALWERAAPPAWGPRIPLREINGSGTAHGVPKVIRYLREHTRPGEAIFVPRAEPLLYFATDTRNPTPYPGVIPALRREQEVVISAGLRDVRYVVMSERDSPIYTYYGRELPAVAQQLERYFEVVPEFLGEFGGWLVVYERAGDRGRLLRDLAVELPARRWTRDEAGGIRLAQGSLPALASRYNRRVVPLAVGPGGGGLDFELRVPPGAVLQTDVGLLRTLSARGVVAHAPVDMVVRVAADGGGFVELARVAVSAPTPTTAGGVGWEPIEVSLDAFAGKDLVVRLEAEPRGRLSRPGLAWWGSPRIAMRSELGG